MIKLEGCTRWQSLLYWTAISFSVLVIILMLADMALSSETKININTATQEEIAWLKGIGKVKSKRIILARPFTHVDSLETVKGIGPKTMEWILPFITLTDSTHIHLEDK